MLIKFLHLKNMLMWCSQANHPMTEAEIRVIISQMNQAMTTQSQAMRIQAEAMTAQDNRDIAPCPHQQVTIMDSRLMGFCRMNPSTFYGSKVDEDPQKFIYEV